MRVDCLKIRNDHNLYKLDAIAFNILYIAIFAVAKGGCCSISDDLSCSCYRALSGVFGHLRKNPVKMYTIERTKGPRQKLSGITHPLSYKV